MFRLLFFLLAVILNIAWQLAWRLSILGFFCMVLGGTVYGIYFLLFETLSGPVLLGLAIVGIILMFIGAAVEE